MPDVLDNMRKEIQDRLQQIKPLIDEHDRLQSALDALAGAVGPGGGTSAPAKRAPTRAKRCTATKTAAKKRTGARPGRKRGSGTRAAQAEALVKAKPGITIPELAKEMGIKQNYLYRVMPGLQSEGKVVKKDKGWHPA